jgi:hypothetical protein
MLLGLREPDRTDELIREAMLRAENTDCPPVDQRCYGFPWGVEEALRSRTPAGRCLTGWVAAD